MSNYKASIDIGSNSTLLLIMDVENKTIHAEESRITGLGKNLDKTGEFEVTSMEATYDALSVYADIAESFNINPEDIVVTATEASRVARNAKDFFKRVKDGLRISIQTISGEGEAFYTAFGICAMASSLGNEVVILDVGGASSEFIKVRTNPFKIIETISLPIGSVRTTDWIASGTFDSELEKVYSKFDLHKYVNTPILGVAGTLTSLALMIEGSSEYNAELINSLSIDTPTFKNFVDENLKGLSPEDFEKFKFLGKRAVTIKGGGICCAELLKKVNCPKIMFSTFGLRYGTLLSGGVDGIYII